MAQNQRTYDSEYKAQALKLAQRVGGHKVTAELGFPQNTVYTRMETFNEGCLSANKAVHTSKNVLPLNDELIKLRKHVKEQDRKSAV